MLYSSENTANTSCEECERPICASDHRTVTQSKYQVGTTVVEKNLVCPSCKDKIIAKQEKSHKRSNIIAVILIIGLVGLTIAVTLIPGLVSP